MKAGERASPKGRLGYELTCAEHAFRIGMDEILRPLGLTAPQYAALLWIKFDPGISNARLAKCVFVSSQTMQVMLAKLESRGLVTRSPDPSHGRILKTELLPDGEEILSKAEERTRHFEEAVSSALNPREAQYLTATMAKFFEVIKTVSRTLKEQKIFD